MSRIIAGIEIPDSVYAMDEVLQEQDGRLDDSLLILAKAPPEIVAEYTRAAQTTPRLSYDQYVDMGNLAMEAADHKERRDGLEAAAGLYDEASRKYMSALTNTPSRDGEAGAFDPLVLFNYGTCLHKLTKAEQLRPYNDPLSIFTGQNKRKNLWLMSGAAFRMAAESMGLTVPED